MPLEKADLAAINKYVRDVVNRVPPRPIKAHTIGTLTVNELVGDPKAPTPASGDSSTKIATTAFVQSLIAAIPANPKITTSALSGGPPTSPANGDIWIATGVDANGTRWQFQYNASSGSAYKWEFIGGPPVALAIGGLGGYTLSTWTSFAGLIFTTVRGGEYLPWGGWSGANSGGAATQRLGISVGGANPSIFAGASIASASYDFNITAQPYPVGAGAGSTISLAYWANAAPNGFYGAGLYVQPRRIS